MVLAGFEFGVNWLTGKSEDSGHGKKARPIGHLKILNASLDKLWLIDNHEHVSILELTSPGKGLVSIRGVESFLQDSLH